MVNVKNSPSCHVGNPSVICYRKFEVEALFDFAQN